MSLISHQFLSLINVFIHLLLQQIFAEHLLCIRHHARCYGYHSEQEKMQALLS